MTEEIENTATAELTLPEISFNPEGWGPCGLLQLDTELPFQLYNKNDTIGKIADFTGSTTNERQRNKYYNNSFVGSQYAYYHEEDESSFQMVDNRMQKTIMPRQRSRINPARLRMDRERRRLNAAGYPQSPMLQKNFRQRQQLTRKNQGMMGGMGRMGGPGGGNLMGGPGMQNRGGNMGRNQMREASVVIRDSYIMKEEMDFVRLNKLQMEPPNEVEDLECCGEMEFYDKKYDRISALKSVPLQRINRVYHAVSTSEDPNLFKWAKEKAGQVFLTDSFMAALMCCTRSVYSWDLVVNRVKDMIFIDKRDKSEFDFLTVNETASQPPTEEPSHINSARNLSLEATYINKNFSQQVLKSNEEKFRFEEENPFLDPDESNELASVGYRYRRFTLPNGVRVVVRCEQDAVMLGPNQETQFINIKALNEWDSRACNGVDWRSKLDSQRGAVLAAELKNNAFKLAKWTCSALLSGSDQIKFGYVSRVNPAESAKHEILGTQQFKPIELANQINLDMAKAWGIFRCIIDICFKLPEGKYLIMKDPNKPALRLYEVPKDAFESDDDGDGEEDLEEEKEDENGDE